MPRWYPEASKQNRRKRTGRRVLVWFVLGAVFGLRLAYSWPVYVVVVLCLVTLWVVDSLFEDSLAATVRRRACRSVHRIGVGRLHRRRH